MRTALRLPTLGALALAAAAACGSVQAAEGWAATRTLQHDVGTAVAGLAVQSGQAVHIAVTLRMRNQADMDALTDALMTGKSNRHITPREFLDRFAPTPAQTQAVVDHLRKAGFIHVEVAANRMLVSADGTAATVQAGFNTALQHFSIDGRDAYANVSDAQVPAHLAGIVSGVHGLQNVHVPHTMLKVASTDMIDHPVAPNMIDHPITNMIDHPVAPNMIDHPITNMIDHPVAPNMIDHPITNMIDHPITNMIDHPVAPNMIDHPITNMIDHPVAPNMIDHPITNMIDHPINSDATPAATAKAVGHNPTEFAAIYDAAGLPPATNATIAIISEGNISQTLTDLSAFATKAGFVQPNVLKVQVGAAGSDTSGLLEWNMDSQSSLSAAGGKVAQMIFYVATTLDDAPLTEAYNRAVTDNVAQSINVSLGECETAAKNSGIMSSNDAIFQIAVAQGQVFSVSSGDSGSYECGGKTGGQSYPAVSPYVMAIGGTLLKTTGATTWASESVWACNGSLGCTLLTGGAGGGASINEPAPAWQLAAGVLGKSTKRGIPDISFDADPNSGALVLNGNKTTQVGGTSLAAPLFAGFWARLQSKNGNALAFPASAIYQYGVTAANAKNMFHDVTTGKNGGYKAAAGWDYASGFGSLDVGKFSTFIDTHAGF